MADLLNVLILAIVQGIAEFLPISSSGHLVLLGSLLQTINESPALQELGESATLEIILHAGTLGSILVIYWRHILNLLSRDKAVIPLLIVGTIPAAVIGVGIKLAFESVLKSTPLAAAMLLVTGTMLIVLGRLKPRSGDYQQLSWKGALAVGTFQAFAILPGISRSGSTILGGRLMGLKNEDSVTFSFLLAIPAILGATVLTAKDLLDPESGSPPDNQAMLLIVGAVVSFVVGIVALKWLIGWSRLDRLHWFAWWCYPVGVAALGLWAAGVIA
ncbi:undecaprenyl-diphosphate phosphatase [Crateriforma conspicua]|uniref:Undecaprenyl-diphosphatase n=1 Tax=Crateriforma conspicua TaxID=2527996 RepID=A0A5C5XX23_9PLAN|nr:undecaprenyl-diphosphate phosphatase [Crateriforma conspicua]TWT67946.1 Undecaprenyl-diphosphatase [Crateriforma conspicua]